MSDIGPTFTASDVEHWLRAWDGEREDQTAEGGLTTVELERLWGVPESAVSRRIDKLMAAGVLRTGWAYRQTRIGTLQRRPVYIRVEEATHEHSD